MTRVNAFFFDFFRILLGHSILIIGITIDLILPLPSTTHLNFHRSGLIRVFLVLSSTTKTRTDIVKLLMMSQVEEQNDEYT